MDAMTFIGVPIDSVGRDGGTENGPAALRDLGLAAALGATDAGDLAVAIRGDERDPVTGLVASAGVLATTATIRAAVAARVRAAERPFLAGGCCAELPGALGGARDALGGPVGLVHVDGHLDLYDGVTSTTGEAADMPIAVALGLGPAAWVEATGGATVSPERLALVGFRDREESIEDGMRQPEELPVALRLCSAADIHAGDAAAIGTELAATVGATPFWLHLDVDVLDQAVFPATDYLMPGGLDWDQLEALITPLLSTPTLIGASVACYNPDKDPDRACGRALVAALK